MERCRAYQRRHASGLTVLRIHINTKTSRGAVIVFRSCNIPRAPDKTYAAHQQTRT